MDATKPSPTHPTVGTLLFAHRGAWDRSPGGPRENTLAAFAAAAANWHGVELDVHQSADRQLVVVHDAMVEGMVIAATPLDTLRAAAPWVPTLGEVLHVCLNVGLRVNVEIKGGSDFYPGIEAAVLEEVNSWGRRETTVISSFDEAALKTVRALDAGAVTAVLQAARPLDPVAAARRCGADGVHTELSLLHPRDVATMRAAGLWVATWTARGPAEIARAVSFGLDAVIADPS